MYGKAIVANGHQRVGLRTISAGYAQFLRANGRFNRSKGASTRTRFTCMVRPSWPRVIKGSVTHNFCGAHLRIRVDKIRLVRLASSRDHHL